MSTGLRRQPTRNSLHHLIDVRDSSRILHLVVVTSEFPVGQVAAAGALEIVSQHARPERAPICPARLARRGWERARTADPRADRGQGCPPTTDRSCLPRPLSSGGPP